ncbi:MAG: sigma 54-interacting transcriptional regulator [Fimbriiglobus sp.]|nr:sigma 54-interacting transcriptional regulator [Fimbriiglobus sp.]
MIRDDLVSRLHAKVYFEEGKWYVRDFGLNGSKLAGGKLEGAGELTEGAELQIGNTRFRFTIGTVLPPTAGGAGTGENNSQTGTAIQLDPARMTRVTGAPTREPPPSQPITVPVEDDTSLRLDELAALVKYMTNAVGSVDAQELIRLSLRTLLNQTSATFVGYLGLDPSDPMPKMILPERVPIDVPLSKRLTEQVRTTRTRVWLFGDASAGLAPASGSLSSFTDAVCLPVGGYSGEPLAAIHAYRTGRPFTERDVNFLQAVSGFLAPALEALRHRRKLEAENLRLRGSAPVADELIGDSSAMMNLRMQIGRAAPLPFTVLITGETGAGKELVALALHRHSPRSGGPLVVVNCAAIAPTLLEAELFGYRKGAFAGADHDHPGLFEQADEGTLFLDEVADLSLECQAKLLRVIEGKSFRPVGGSREVNVDVRVVAATHRDLEAEVRHGKFRQDLLFRLRVITVKVPPLREHAEDIPELSRFFLERISQQLRKPLRLSAAAERKLFAYAWPGNVRQLRAILESGAVMTEGDVIEADLLPLGPVQEAAPTASADLPTSLDIDDIETWAILRALRQTSGNVSQAARVLGISRDTLHTKLKKKNIDRGSVLAPASADRGDDHTPPP